MFGNILIEARVDKGNPFSLSLSKIVLELLK